MTVTRRLGVFGLSIEDVAARLSDRLTKDCPHLSLETGNNEVTVLLSVEADSPEAAAPALEEGIAFVRDRLGVFVYGEDVPDLQHRVVSLLLEKNKKIATAESCTAGILSGKLTEVGGVSAVFECGVASYSNEIKHSVLGVPTELLEAHGAVSEPVAAAMATGVRRISGADFGIGITGVAGPTESEGKPVGTVFIALADEKRVWVKAIHHQNADREEVRLFAVMTALDLARRYLEALPGVMAGALSLEKPSSETMVFPVGRVKKLHFWSPLFPSKSQGKAALFRAIALWLLIVLTVFGVAFSLYYFIYRPFRNEQIYDQLESVYYAGLADTSVVVDTSMYPDEMLSRFFTLYDQNKDVRGWIKIDGTSISYPVMDSRHSTYYASHDFLGNPSDYGVPYFAPSADFSSVKAAQNNHVLTIYGNQAGADHMFSPLLGYADSSFYAIHEYLSLNTLYSEQRYRVIAVFAADSSDNNAEFPYDVPPKTKAERSAFYKEIEARSFYKLPAPLTDNSNLLLLSVDAPNDNFQNRRLVVVAEQLPAGSPEPAFKIIANDHIQLPQAANGNNDNYDPLTTTRVTTTRAATTRDSAPQEDVTTARRDDPTPPPVTVAPTTRGTKPTTRATTAKTTKPTTRPPAKPTEKPTTKPAAPTTPSTYTTAPTAPSTTESAVFTTVTPDRE